MRQSITLGVGVWFGYFLATLEWGFAEEVLLALVFGAVFAFADGFVTAAWNDLKKKGTSNG